MTFLCTVIVRLLYILLSFFEHFSEVRALSYVLFQYFCEIFPEFFFVFSEKMKIVQKTLGENEYLQSTGKRKKFTCHTAD